MLRAARAAPAAVVAHLERWAKYEHPWSVRGRRWRVDEDRFRSEAALALPRELASEVARGSYDYTRVIMENPTFVAAVEGEIVGFGTVQIEGCEAVLDHLWVSPQFMGRGVGRALFLHAGEIARARGAIRMRIVGDPHAEQFYSRMAATVYGQKPASMDGEARFLPLLEKAL